MINKIQELLNEEKWTRATISSYTVSNFEELDKIIEDIELDDLMDVKELCDEHLTHTKTSIIALYLSGVISLKKHFIDDSNLLELANLFYDNRKWKIVEYLCTKILSFGENRVALRILADTYDNQDREKEKFEVWERLIKIDYEETDILKTLADRAERNGDLEKAVDYWKKSIHRFINKRNFSQIKEAWNHLIKHIPHEYDYLLNVNSRVQKAINKEKAAQLLDELFLYYNEQQDWDKAIDILKLILQYQPNNSVARASIIACYKEKYKDHSKLESFIEKSNLNQSYRDIQTAIEDFEKHIAFDEGTFVYHKTWGIGRIKELRKDNLVIDFATKRDHTMALSMAVTALLVLPKNHIWVIKSVFPKDVLKDKVKKDVSWALKTIITSFNNSVTLKRIKAELVPSILTANEWLSWSSNAKKVLKTDPLFSINPESNDEYMVRSTPITYDEKTLNVFKGEKDIYKKIKVVKDFLENSDPDSDYFAEIFSFFTGILKSFNTVNDAVITSFLFTRRIIRQYPFLNDGADTLTFKELYDRIENIEGVFSNINDSEIKRMFLDEIKRNDENWPSVYKRLFAYYQTTYIIDSLMASKHTDEVISLFRDSFEAHKEDPEKYVWLVKNFSKDFWIKKVGITYDRLVISLLHLLDISYRAIENKKEVTKYRKLVKNISSILFEDGELLNYLRECDLDSVKRLYPLIKDIGNLDPAIKIEVKHIVKERFPDYIFHGERDQTEAATGGLLVTEDGLQRKEEELRYITEVAIPENSKEIGEARLLGDLKENAEYKAGKERQELLNINLGKLKDELSRATVVDPKQIDPSKISFGTKIVLHNNNTQQDETYIILGPWESDPANNIISYLAPFGSALLAKRPGDHLEFEINERAYNYDVKSVEKYLQ
ncbi:MAG: transcription elongation factor GreA [Spirochaetota bacterium]